MNSYRKTAIIVGVLFIIATAASILSSVFLGALDASNYLTSISANENQVLIGMILELIAAVSAFGTAVMLFPVLKKTIESLALGYVALRLIENIFYIVGALSIPIMLTLGQGYVAAASNASYYQLLGTLLLALHDWSIWMGTLIFFGLGSLTLNYLLYQSKLVPRFLSVWGLIGAALAFLFGLLSLFILTPGFNIFTILAIPIAVQEMVFAVWLIVKGFNPAAIASLSPHLE